MTFPDEPLKSNRLFKPKEVTACRRPVLDPCTLESFAYQVDPYIGCGHLCSYCYVLGQAETDWAQEIKYHADLIDRLNEEIRGLEPRCIYMGWHTDPYQPCEEDLGQTRQVLELLREKGFSASILTKSDLVLRDLDILREMEQASVAVSVAFTDDIVRSRFEANTVDTETRIDVLRELKAAGIQTTAMLCPVIPRLTRLPLLIDQLAPHVVRIWVYGLSILDQADQSWQNVRRILSTHYPELQDEVEAAVLCKEHDYWKALREELEELARDRKLNLSIHL